MYKFQKYMYIYSKHMLIYLFTYKPIYISIYKHNLQTWVQGEKDFNIILLNFLYFLVLNMWRLIVHICVCVSMCMYEYICWLYYFLICVNCYDHQHHHHQHRIPYILIVRILKCNMFLGITISNDFSLTKLKQCSCFFYCILYKNLFKIILRNKSVSTNRRL